MTTLLMVAFEFPPATSVGMRRSLMLARHLPGADVRPVVVTTDAASLAAWFGGAVDESPLASLPPATDVRRVPCPRPGTPTALWRRRLRRMFMAGTEDIGSHWEAPLTAAWDRLLADTRPAAVYVSLPPFSVAPLAATLARRSRLPLILDFRDNWSQWCHSPHATWLHYRVTLRRERACVEQAAAVVTTTAQIARDIQAAHPRVDPAKFHAIPTGFDGGALPPVVSTPPAGRPFVIGYVGSFYYDPQLRRSMLEPWWRRSPLHWLNYSPRREDWLYRTPYFFFAALARLLADQPALRSQVRVRFAGDRQDWLDHQAAYFGLQDVIEHAGRLSHAESLAFQRRCDALLATSARVIGGRDPYIAGKTFEYMVAGRPVVSFAADGEQRDFWQASGLAVTCDPDDPAGAARSLAALIAGGFQPKPDTTFLEGFRSADSARRLAAIVRGRDRPAQ